MEADNGNDHDDHETDKKIREGVNDGDYHYLKNFGTSCVCVCVCARARACMYVCVHARVFCFLCPECTHNLNRLFNAYSVALHNLQRSGILNDCLLFMLMPIFSSVCVLYGSLCFCVNAGELMIVSRFELCDSP